MTISKRLIKKLTLGIAGLIVSATVSSTAMAAGNVASGKKLFTGSKCNQCHGTEVFTSKDRKVTSLPALKKRVSFCDTNLDTNWFDEDVEDVTAYLNQQYYKF